MSQKCKVAVAQYDIGFFNHFDEFAAKLEGWFQHAYQQNAELLVFPEYGSMELASVFGETVYSDLHQQLYAMQSLYKDYQACYAEFAKRYNTLVLASSFPLQITDRSFRNRANLFGPDGLIGYQDKLIMTRFENEQWIIAAGEDIHVLHTDIGNIGINICYDSEFPIFAQQQVAAGVDLLLVPSCTDGTRGFNRVRIGCQARALENQCYVLHSPTVGNASWSPAVDCNTGNASIYTPVDRGFPADGILAQLKNDQAQWLFAELDMAEIAHIRQEGQVLNHRDWHKQFLARLTVR
jgi:predicted amidohydrolase